MARPFRFDVLRRHASLGSWAIPLLLAWCSFLFFYGLNAGELYRTESLRAIIGAQCLRSGNWIVPTLYDEPLFTKPPGMYVAIALVSWPCGAVTEWTARLPSALAATATVFLFYWYFRRHVGQRAGLVAAFILPTSAMWLDKASAAEIDMLQTFWVTAAILFFLRALEADEDRESRIENRESHDPSRRSSILYPLSSSWFWWLASLLCVAGGVLTKWTAPAFFYGMAAPLLWWRGRLRLLFGWCHLLSAALAACVCLVWIGAAVASTGWDTFYDTVSREALQRLSPSHHLEVRQLMSADHQPAIYPWAEVLVHPFKLLTTNLPWSAFALVTLWPGFARLWDERGRRLLLALHCWTWPNLIFWSVIPEHATRHSFPLFPGIAGLAALVWLAWLDGRLRWPVPRIAPVRVLVGLLLLWLVVKLAFVHTIVPRRNFNREPRAKGEQIAAVVPENKTLYLFRLKDEGIMFYYGRAVQRLASPDALPSSGGPLYCILDESEWLRWHGGRTAEALLRLNDEQGAPIVLVKVT